MNWFKDTPSFSENASAFFRIEGINLSGNLSPEAALRCSVAIRFHLPESCEELDRRKNVYAVLFARNLEVLCILGNQRIRPSVDGHIQNHVVIGIA